MRKFILLGVLVLFATLAMGPQINTSGRCSSGLDCDIGDGKPSGITLNTDGGDFNVDGTTGNTATMTATTTATAVFQGADAAGAADTTFDTTGAGAIVVGSADVTGVTLTTDGASLNIEGTTANTLTLTAATTGTMTIMGADASGASALAIDTSGAGSIAYGSADVTGHTFTSDGLNGSVVLDGSVLAQMPVVSLASGALTMNTIHLATATGADYDIPDATCSAAADIGNWVTVVVEDASSTISITVDDASNVIYVPGLGLGADDELDSVSTAAHEGLSITLTCLAAEGWYMTAGNLNLIGSSNAIAWADGGAAD